MPWRLRPRRRNPDSSDVPGESPGAVPAFAFAKTIETEMTYPGEIKATLIREVRSVEYAK
jgi:hypothetical protein